MVLEVEYTMNTHAYDVNANGSDENDSKKNKS